MVVRNLGSYTHLLVASYMITMMLCVFSLCYLLVKSERSSLRTSLTIAQSTTIIWLMCLILEWVSLTADMLHITIRVGLISLNFVAPLWTISILLFTERLSKKHYWLIPIILLIPFVISVQLLFPASTEIFKLYIEEFYLDEYTRVYYLIWGPSETISGIYSLFCVILSFCYLFDCFRKNNTIRLVEKIAALLILCSPITTHYLGKFLNSSFDFKPLTFSLWGATVIYLALYRQFFNAIPSQVWNIFNEIRECMIVLSADGSISTNKTFTTVFGNRGDDVLGFAEELYPGLSDVIIQKQEAHCLETKLGGVFYEISVKNLLGRKNKVIGQLLSISDITTTKQLTLTNERARIASGLHDTMGNNLIASINNLNLALTKPTPEEVKSLVDMAVTNTVASLMTLRRIVEGLAPVNFAETRLITLIESVINRIMASGVYVEFQHSGELDTLPIEVKEFIYNACQEGMTNSMIHGKAENIIIRLECKSKKVSLDIVDNGRGCDIIYKNNGLTIMENRVNSLGGIIRFGSPSSGGFGIYSEIPIS